MAMTPADAVDRWLTEQEVGGSDDTYDGTIEDLTGQDAVTIRVGAPGNGGDFAFSPSAARVTQGTELVFEWTGNGGAHNVESLPDEQLGLSDYEFSSGDPMQGEGVQYTRTMDVAGVMLSHCEPHLSLGMKGGIVVEPSEELSPEDAVDRWLTETTVGGADDTYDGTIEDLTGQETVTVQVGAPGNGGDFAFSPSAARVSRGTEIQFEWTGEGGEHNVESLPEEQLGLSDYEFSSGEPLQAEGVQYTRTVDVAGVLLTHCEPHLSLGMKGGIVVE
jgi:halocyanin-like protein